MNKDLLHHTTDDANVCVNLNHCVNIPTKACFDSCLILVLFVGVIEISFKDHYLCSPIKLSLNKYHKLLNWEFLGIRIHDA